MAENRFTPKNHEEPQKRILIIDGNDGEEFLRVRKEKLEEAGNYVVDYEQDGSKAIERIRHFRPDVITLDVILAGGMDGGEVCKQMISDPELSGLPIVWVSALWERTPGPEETAAERKDYAWVRFLSKQGLKTDTLVKEIEEAYAAAPGPGQHPSVVQDSGAPQ